MKSLTANDKLKLATELGLSKQDLLGMYRFIIMGRKVDDAEIAMRKQGMAHFQISGAGHEAVQVAVAKLLRPSHDLFFPYYRDRAFSLAVGMTPFEMLCQAHGNVDDIASGGRQMPSHWGHKKLNIFTQSSSTGMQFLQAVGVAEVGRYLEKLSEKVGDISFNSDEIIYCSSGEGTTSQGEFWESITTASVNNLPVLYVIQDNGYAISVPVSAQTPLGSISKTLAHFPNFKIYEVDGNCPVLSFKAAKEAIEHIRSARGPVLLHAHCTRPYAHALTDDQRHYRTKEELEEETYKDCVNSFPRFLIESGVAVEQELTAIASEVASEVSKARSEAVKRPLPKVETICHHVYSEDVDPCSEKFETEPHFSGKADQSMALMINKTLKSEIARNPLIRVFGEDVADFSELGKLQDARMSGKGGVFKVTSGVQRVGRLHQVFNSPLAEANIIGRAVGMSMRGLKPVVEIQFFDYIWTAFMQIKNEVATVRYRSNNEFKCPMVIRVASGGYLKGGSLCHSQSGESFFTHIPGLRVVVPSNALDAAGLLRTAIRSDDPVLFLEHKHLYYQGYNRCADPGDEFMIPFGKAKVVKEGRNATVVCWGALVQRALDAAKRIESKRPGSTIEVIDARTLAPFDMETVKKSLHKTKRILIAHEETKTSGFAGEIAIRVNEECFEDLDAPIMRVATPDTHIAYQPELENAILPQSEDVERAIMKLLEY